MVDEVEQTVVRPLNVVQDEDERSPLRHGFEEPPPGRECFIPTVAAQLCVRTDRRSAYEQVDLGLAEALQNELRHGNRVLAAGAREGARRFASGAGRGGRFQ